MTLRPCIDCGQPTDQTRCPDCAPTHNTQRTTSFRDRGYSAAWDKLSKRARKLQPFCTDCGATENLQLDHTPETWARIAAGKVVRLEHTGGVVCGRCNTRRGAARGSKTRGDTPVQAGLVPPGEAQRPMETRGIQ